MPIAKDVNLEKLADISHGFVGADLQALAKEAAMRALRRVLPEIESVKLKVFLRNFKENYSHNARLYGHN